MCEEIALSGGRITQGVVKKGDYVLRPCCPNFAFVHDVLKWLELKNISVTPKFIGLADDGHEVTSFLEGTAPDDLGYFNDNQLFATGKIIKELHTALTDFPGCLDGQTVCHNDLSPCNFMFKNELPYAVFDWDSAGIGDPLNDVAYALWMWCRIGSPENSPTDVGKMISVILDSYELCNEKRKFVIDKIYEQIQRVETSMTDFLTASQQYEKRLSFQQWTNDCDSWLHKYQNQIVQYFIK